jgi:hypothetical protein
MVVSNACMRVESMTHRVIAAYVALLIVGEDTPTS